MNTDVDDDDDNTYLPSNYMGSEYHAKSVKICKGHGQDGFTLTKVIVNFNVQEENEYKRRYRLTLASSRRCQRGTMKYNIPLMAPGSVKPRISKTINTTYGNVAVK